MSIWKTADRSLWFEANRFLHVEKHRVELPDGRVIDDWPWIVTPDFVIVVARTPEGSWVCFEQNKYGAEGVLVAPVGGYLESGELPLDGARRELLEEAGLVSDHWISLGSYVVDANRGCGVAHLFLAQDATSSTVHVSSDDLEDMRPLRLSTEALRAALASGHIKILPWAAAFSMALAVGSRNGLV